MYFDKYYTLILFCYIINYLYRNNIWWISLQEVLKIFILLCIMFIQFYQFGFQLRGRCVYARSSHTKKMDSIQFCAKLSHPPPKFLPNYFAKINFPLCSAHRPKKILSRDRKWAIK